MTYEESLLMLAEEYDNIIVMTAENRAAIRNLPDRLGERFIDVGICEQTMVGAAAGLALRGRIPVVHALASFLTMRAFEFIRTDVAVAGLPVKLVGGVPGFLSEANGPTHQAIEDISLMRSIPGMQVVCPADEEELVAALPSIVRSESPCYIRFNASRPAVSHTVPFELGKAELIADGDDIAILTFGYLLGEAECARTILASKGYSVRLLNMRSLVPVDVDAIIRAAEDATMLVTIEDHLLTGGLAAIVAAILARYRIHVELLPIALPNRWFRPGLLSDVLHVEGFTGGQLAERILELF